MQCVVLSVMFGYCAQSEFHKNGKSENIKKSKSPS